MTARTTKRTLIALAAAAATVVAPPLPSEATNLAALTTHSELVVFDPSAPSIAQRLKLKGFLGKAIGVDFRPADGRVYLVNRDGEVFAVTDGAGTTEFVATLTIAFPGDRPCGFDFTPQADRLRLVGVDGDNLRVNAILGAAARDRGVSYRSDDEHAGRRPRIAGVAYTKNFPAADTTVMFNIDARHDTLVVQDPPNDGLLHSVGALGIDVGDELGFEIVSATDGGEAGYLAHRGTLYRIDLESGATEEIGVFDRAQSAVVGLSIWPFALISDDE